MAGDAIARLYDVDEDSVVFTRLDKTEQYDQGIFKFRARKGRSVELDQVHESLWATRLSGGTKSGLIRLQVTLLGRIRSSTKGPTLQGLETGKRVALVEDPEQRDAFGRIADLPEGTMVKLTGVVDNYSGRWPNLLKKKPPKMWQVRVLKIEPSNQRSQTQ